MKKRILSLALVVVMVVAMIPATLVTALAAQYTGRANGYDVYFSETEPTMDGQMDAAYANSEKIIMGHRYLYKGEAQNTSFEAYAMATSTGVYYFVDVTDSTVDATIEANNSQGTRDKTQIYMQIANTTKDGDASITKYQEKHFDFDYGHSVASQSSDAKSASVITENGYAIEMFIPWTVWTNITNGLSVNTAKVYFGIQVNNYDENEQIYKEMAADCALTPDCWTGDYQPADADTAPKRFLTKANVITSAKNEIDSSLYYTANIVDDNDITLDGEMDEVYNFTGKITPGYAHSGTIGVDGDFATYILATEKGIYVFASIMDDTLDKPEACDVRDGDKFQLALSLGNTYWQRWGYIDFDYVNGGRDYITGKSSGFGGTEDIEYITSIWNDEKGWDLELYIPYTFCADTSAGNIGLDKGVLSQNDLTLKVNIQVNNHKVNSVGDNGRTNDVTVYGQFYDIKKATISYSTNSVHVPVKFAKDEGFGQIVYAPKDSITFDGVKDAVYGGDETAFTLPLAYKSGSCSHSLKSDFKVWAAIAGDRLCIYGEFTDADINATNQPDGVTAYVTFPYSGGNAYVGLGYSKAGHWTTSYTWGGNRDTFWYVNKPQDDARWNMSATQDHENGKYTLEFSIGLPDTEKLLLENGVSFPIGLALEYNDCCSDNNGTCAVYRSSVPWGYWTSVSDYRQNMPRWTVNNTLTAEAYSVKSKITGASVVLADSINIKYTANVPADALNVVMKYTYNDKVTYVRGNRTSDTTVDFMFEDLAPQCMGDNIKAELYVDGDKVDSVDEYSVKQNIENITAPEKDPSVELKNLCNALLLYGAAAQQYTNYKATETELVADLSDIDVMTVWDIDSVKEVGSAADKARFVGAGVRFANVNKIYVKVDNVENVASLTVKVGDGEPVALELNSNGVAYTDAIKATEFGNVYTFELTDTNEMSQTLKYSVNSYVYVKTAEVGDMDSDFAVLSAALYNYGVAAEEYNAN